MREDVGVNSQKNKPEETDILRLHSGPGCMSTTHERDTSLAQSVEAKLVCRPCHDLRVQIEPRNRRMSV